MENISSEKNKNFFRKNKNFSRIETLSEISENSSSEKIKLFQ